MPLTATEAAAKLGLNPKTLRQKLRDGVIKGRQIGRNTWVVEEGDVEEYRFRAGTYRADPTLLPATLPGGRQKYAGAANEAPEVSGFVPEPADTKLLERDAGPVPPVRSANEPATAWLLLAVGENRAFGSNDGYDDEPEAHYKWDDTVPNHGRVSVGDAVVLWDKKTSIGASIIESIATASRTKPIYSCPICRKAHIKARQTKMPRYKCFRCQSDFDEPITTVKKVREYTSTHSGAWVDLSGLLPGARLRALCESPKSQLSLRPLEWERFKAAVAEAGGPEILTVVEASRRMIAGGHRTANVRVRLGQGVFRRELLAKLGAVCAFTGRAPVAALEAAHLYSYAKAGEHHRHGGLLMRRDLHRLFDLGLIAVHPKTLTIDVAPSLSGYPLYQELSGRPLKVKATQGQTEWLKEHWNEHRTPADAGVSG
ncbi:HNH endonuclease [Arthrobacter sp. NPDC093125]|uniref:HNH endonuclease n=1 Tax=Arthrobacter sp. NPDC093125 TaxID=3363944 RepID=UPI0037F61A6A